MSGVVWRIEWCCVLPAGSELRSAVLCADGSGWSEGSGRPVGYAAVRGTLCILLRLKTRSRMLGV